MTKQFEVPKEWGASPQQEVVIGSLVDEAGKYIAVWEFCEALYGDPLLKKPAPAKLRVLVQRCRAVLFEHTTGNVKIVTRRNSGYKITKSGAALLRKIVEETS